MPISTVNVVAFFVTVLAQLGAIALLPKTEGFTRPLASVACAGLFLVGAWALSRLTRAGVALGILIPLMGAVIPLASIGIGIAIYGESSSWTRVALLVVASVLVGIAAGRN